jgi:imidazolonepropionase
LSQIDFVDAFCELGVFDVEQTRRLLSSGRSLFRCDVQLHAEQLTHQASAELAAELGARSISHAEHVSDEGIAAMAASGCSVVLCPASQQVMRSVAPPARKMIQANVAVALGSDFCPNAYCYSMAHAMHLAVVNNRLTVNEALVAATINAAHALNREAQAGSLEVGKWGDALLLSNSSWQHIVYQFGDVRSVIRSVIKKGHVVDFPTQHEPLFTKQ